MQLSDIDQWSVPSLHAISYELGGELRTIEQVAADLDALSALPGWNSPAADAARGRFDAAKTGVLNDAAVIGAVEQLAVETATAVTKLQTELADLRADIASYRGDLALSDSGAVTITATGDRAEELKNVADQLESRAKALIRQAKDIDADCSEVFSHVAAGDVTAAGATNPETARQAGRDQSGLSAPYPPAGAPADVTAWWNALSEDERHSVIAEHPDWIGNRDGVPVWARSEGNVGFLEQEITAAQAELTAIPNLDELATQFPGLDQANLMAIQASMRAVPQERLDNSMAIKQSLSYENRLEKGYDPDKFLMMFDAGNRDRETLAAIALGNPDEAKHVAVTTPGMNTHATSLPGMAAEATVLQAEIENQLENQKIFGEQVATIAWLGYDPPDVEDASLGEVLGDRRADEGADDLARFYQGINATNMHGSEVHLSALGHSYGSLTTAQALSEFGADGVVDDAVFYGSPGLGFKDVEIAGPHGIPTHLDLPVNSAADLHLDSGHVFVMSTPDDPVSGGNRLAGIELPAIADLGGHGPNPTTLPFEQLGTGTAVTPDGVSREGASGHSEYPRYIETPGGPVLRTTGYNLAIVAAGLADDHPELLQK